jgi:LAO/AO transport system kinase
LFVVFALILSKKVEGVVDSMLLVLAPGAGDQLQGMKRGLTELADIVAVNKADGELEAVAARAASDYRASLRLLGARKTPGWTPPVLRCSAQTGKGVTALLGELERHRAALGNVRVRRTSKEWAQLWLVCSRMHLAQLRQSEKIRELLPGLQEAVECGELTVDLAARRVLECQ